MRDDAWLSALARMSDLNRSYDLAKTELYRDAAHTVAAYLAGVSTG